MVDIDRYETFHKCITYILPQILLGNCLGIHTSLSECVLGWGKTILIYASYMQYSKMCTFRKKTKFGSKCSQKSFSAWRVCMTKTRVSDEKMLFFPTLRYSHTLLSWTDVMSLENRRSKVLCGCDIHPSSFYYETNYGNGGIISTMWEKVY